MPWGDKWAYQSKKRPEKRYYRNRNTGSRPAKSDLPSRSPIPPTTNKIWLLYSWGYSTTALPSSQDLELENYYTPIKTRKQFHHLIRTRLLLSGSIDDLSASTSSAFWLGFLLAEARLWGTWREWPVILWAEDLSESKVSYSTLRSSSFIWLLQLKHIN